MRANASAEEEESDRSQAELLLTDEQHLTSLLQRRTQPSCVKRHLSSFSF